MTKAVIVHVKIVPNRDVSEDGREGRVRARPCRKTSETQAKVARITWEVWEISWDLTQSRTQWGKQETTETFLFTISLPSNQLSIRLEDRACVPRWDTGPWLPNMSVLTCRELRQGLRRGARLCPSELRAVPAAKGEAWQARPNNSATNTLEENHQLPSLLNVLLEVLARALR